MGEMSGLDKLRVLLPHWIEHNNSHIAEFTKWQQVAADEAGEEVLARLREAVTSMTRTGESLAEALKIIGGPLEFSGHHHHHRGHD